MSTITTYQKILFDPLDPKEADISIVDIAHALSLLCRAGGHFPHFYSVAQHCVHCAKEALARGYSQRVALGCLLHDASEAYLSDITRPVKAHLPRYLEIEETLQTAIYRKWLSPILNDEELSLVKAVDDTLLYYEFYHIMKEPLTIDVPPLLAECEFGFVPFETIESAYLSLFQTLVKTGE